MLRLWRTDPTLPLRYGPVDDTKFYLMLVKSVIEHGSYLSNPNLGAPFGQHLNDYPQGADNLNLLIIRGLALFSSNPAVVMNVFFLITFAGAGFTAHLVLRSQGVSPTVAGVLAVLFSLLPYHFFRGESHLLLSAYYGVPLAAYLFLSVLGEVPLFSRRAKPGHPVVGWLSVRSVQTIALCVVIGSDNLYYAVFALVLLLAAVVITLVLRRGRAAVSAGLLIGLIVLTLGVNLAPTFLYRAAHGANSALRRSAVADESSVEAFSLRLPNLILPAPANTISPLRAITRSYDHAIAPAYCEACYGSVGPVGTIGLLWLAVCALATLVGATGWYGSGRLFRHAAAGIAVALAVGTAGGLSSLIEVALTPDIRGWNRISVTIAFLSLLGAALLLDSLRSWLDAWAARVAGAAGATRATGASRAGGTAGPVLGGLMLAAVLTLGVLDQTSGFSPSTYVPGDREYRSDARFVSEIQARLPRGAEIFQLPYVPFPEGYPNTPVSGAVATYATKYESLRGYLHSSTLRWSYGAMKGRAEDWSGQLAGQPLDVVLAAVAAAGFDGVWVDPAGFEPAKAKRVEAVLRTRLGAPLLSPDGDLEFFDLRPYRARLARSGPASQSALTSLGALTLRPPLTGCAPGARIRDAAAPFGPPGAGSGAAHVIAGLRDPSCPR